MKMTQKISLLASLVVVIAFFLPWSSSVSGPELVKGAINMFKLAEYNNEWILIGVASLLFLLLPIVCHLISLIVTLKNKAGTKILALIPLCFWIFIFIYFSIKIGEPAMPSNMDGFSIGFIGTLTGQVVAVVAAFLRK